MVTHIIPDHLHQDHLEMDDNGKVVLKQKPRGGGHLSNTPQVTTTIAGTKYKVPMTLVNGTTTDLEIDNDVNGIKYTGTADKTLLFMASMGASSDSNATECEWAVFVNAVESNIQMQRYFDKQDKGGAFTLLGRVDVSQNNTLYIHVSSDVPGAVITHNTINIEIFEV